MESLKPKIAIIGAGKVGSTFAFSLMISGLAREIVLIDKNESLAIGECMDLNHGLSFAYPTRIYAAGYEGCKDADIVVITAGANQKPDQTRTDLIHTNVAIFREIVPAITKYTHQSCRHTNLCNPEIIRIAFEQGHWLGDGARHCPFKIYDQ